MKNKLLVSLAILSTLTFFWACNKDAGMVSNQVQSTPTLPETPYRYPGGDNDRATLGRVLFYDTHLSLGNSVSCGSCHKQSLAFSDNTALSLGYNGQNTTRNTPPIQNLESFNFEDPTPSFLFWDGRETNLTSMVTKPILNHLEMGMFDTKQLTEKVIAQPYYAELFDKAFPNEPITSDLIASAIASFVRNTFSNNSAFDNFARMGNAEALSPKEKIGFDLFTGKYDCSSCHQLLNPKGYSSGNGEMSAPFANIGLETNYADSGFGKTTNRQQDIGKFKIPNLRNVALTAPYMHDGRFKTLDEVLNHYSHGIMDQPNLDSRLKDENGNAKVLNISAEDRVFLLAFLHSLTDGSFVTNPIYSDPFKSK